VSATRALPDDEVHVWSSRGSREGFALDVLGHYCGRARAEGALRRTALGKPFLAGEPLQFSVSRSAGLEVVAVATMDIGIDVERIAALPELDALALTCLAEGEARAWSALEPERRTAYFYRCWTRKEACLKAMGVGLHVEPRAIDTSIDGGPWQWHEPWDERDWALAVACDRVRARIVRIQ
jgi:phosphopantetheinyl transferase